VPEIGIRELKNQASEILRAVREEGAEYVITHRGKPVAVLLPVRESRRLTAQPGSETAERLEVLGLEIDADGKGEAPAVELISDEPVRKRGD
jgi:prevent-host-death family protein